jgi:hypothetical protein
MMLVHRAAGAVLLVLGVAVVSGCSKLTDPTYEFMTLRAIDGQPLPVAIRFGPDSGLVSVRSGRLGFANARLGLPCRLEIKVGFGVEKEGGGGIGDHPRCQTGGGEPFVAEGSLSFDAGSCPTFQQCTMDRRFSGRHQLSFSGLIRTKSPEF